MNKLQTSSLFEALTSSILGVVIYANVLFARPTSLPKSIRTIKYSKIESRFGSKLRHTPSLSYNFFYKSHVIYVIYIIIKSKYEWSINQWRINPRHSYQMCQLTVEWNIWTFGNVQKNVGTWEFLCISAMQRQRLKDCVFIVQTENSLVAERLQKSAPGKSSASLGHLSMHTAAIQDIKSFYT